MRRAAGPAYSALVATTIPKEQLARANGMISLGRAGGDPGARAGRGAAAAVGVPGC